MTPDAIHQVMNSYIANGEMAGGSLLVRKNDEIVFDGKWGYADMEKQIPITDNTVFRMASMTKVVTAVAIMKLVNWGWMIRFPSICRSLRRCVFAMISGTNGSRE